MNKVFKNTVYNLIGSFVYLFSQWLMSILVIRLSGSYEEAGVFGLAISITNVFYIFSTFSVRNYQISDINEQFSNSEYITLRLATCAISLLILPIYLTVMQYSLYASLSVTCYMLIRTVEACIDVIQGALQKIWRLDLACISYIVRGITNLLIFSLVEWMFKNLVVSLLLTAIASLICAFLLDFHYCIILFNIKLNLRNSNLIRLLKNTFPLFIHGLLSALIYSIPRIVAQKLCGDELFGFYSSIAAPTVVIQLAVSGIFSTYITVMSDQYYRKDKRFFRSILKIQGIILAIGVLAVVGFSLLGDYFLIFAFGDEILKHADLLLPAVIATVFISTMAFVASIFTVIGHNKMAAILGGMSFVADLLLSFAFIKKYDLQGINYALIFSCILFILIGYAILIPISRDQCSSNSKV